jgi:hypothetical protein
MAINAILGDINQNSYVTVAEADAYFADRAFASAWSSFEDKESLLILCSRMLDWYISWKGFKKAVLQPMEWPRTYVIVKDGTELSDELLPNEVKIAVFELAISSLTEDRTGDDPLLGLEQLRVATLMLKAKPDKSGDTTLSKEAIPAKVFKILKELRSQSSFGVVRLMRG